MKRALSLQFAKALFRSSKDAQQLKEWHSRLKAFADLLEQSPDFYNFLVSTQFSQEEKEKVLQKCYKERVDSKFLCFIEYVIQQQKLAHLPVIIQEYTQMLNDKAGIVQAEFAMANPIDLALVESLKAKLEAAYEKEIQIEQKVCPSLIGGGILTIGHQMWDFSIQNRLKQMRQTLLTEIRQEP